MIKCPNVDCGYENVDGTQFCEGCGEELPHGQHTAGTATTGAAPATGGASIKCPACDNMNPPDNVVCEVCGTELKGAGMGHTLTPDVAIAPPVVGVLGNDTGHPVATDSHPAADTTVGSLAGAGITSADTGHTDLSGTIAVPATAPPVGGMASPPASVGLSALDAAAMHSAASPGVPAMATGLDTAMSDPTADNTASATVAAPSAPSAAGHLEPGHVKMTVEQGMLVGQQFVLGDNEMLVGREDEEESIYPDIDLSDQDAGYVHRRHASLKFDNGNLTVTHLGGTNKTRINNRPLPDNTPQAVNLGDKVAFGKVVLRVQAN